MTIHILPGDQPDVIVTKFMQADDEVRVHYSQQPYDMGAVTIQITNKQKGLKIVGLDPRGNEVNADTATADVPAILGTAAALLTPGQNPINCGVFNIGPACSVEIKGLRLVHQILPYAAGSGHGSATIAALVDNTNPSALSIKNCVIDTNATTAISIRSNTAPSAVRADHAINDIEVSDCRITGNTNAGILAGNYSGVNLGSFGLASIDMRNAKFEVKGCTLIKSVFGIIAGNVRADAKSKFEIKKNEVGPTAFGVCVMSRPPVAEDLAKGDINITQNTIQMQTYLDLPEIAGGPRMGAAGIIVRVSSAPDGQQKRISITNNEIDMTQLPVTSVAYRYKDAIVHELVPAVAQNVATEVTWNIKHNSIVSPVAAAAAARAS